MPLPPSTTTFSGATLAGSMKRSAAAWKLGADVDVLGRAAAAASPEPGLDGAADVVDALVAAERQRPRAHELGAGVGLRVVRGGAHQAAVEAARADEEIEHLGADHPGVEDVGALGHHARAVARAQLGRGEAHVAPQPDAQLAGVLAGHVGEHAHERAADLLGPVAVELLAVEAADVVGLEDLWGDWPSARRLAAPARRASGRRGQRAGRELVAVATAPAWRRTSPCRPGPSRWWASARRRTASRRPTR